MQKPQVDHLRCFSIKTGFHGRWYQRLPHANNIHFLIHFLSFPLHLPVSFVYAPSPLPTRLPRPLLGFAVQLDTLRRSTAAHLPACGHMCICAGTTLPANVNTARTSKVGTTWAQWLPCQCHLTPGWTGFWRVKWRNYIQVVMIHLQV